MTDHELRFGRIIRVISFLMALLPPAQLLAVPARDAVETVRQPDGSAITIRQFGDEWANGHRTLDGFTILQDPSDGVWKYAEEDANGDLGHSPWIVGRDRPEGKIGRASCRERV